MKYTSWSNSSGQSLLEVVAGVAAILIVIFALVGLGITSVRRSTISKSTELATRMVHDLTERVRLFRDEMGISQLPDSTAGCALVAGLDLYLGSSETRCSWRPYPANINFSYRITSEPPPAGVTVENRLILVEVRLPSSAGGQIVSTTSLLTGWQE